jgi:hypothetical protein
MRVYVVCVFYEYFQNDRNDTVSFRERSITIFVSALGRERVRVYGGEWVWERKREREWESALTYTLRYTVYGSCVQTSHAMTERRSSLSKPNGWTRMKRGCTSTRIGKRDFTRVSHLNFMLIHVGISIVYFMHVRKTCTVWFELLRVLLFSQRFFPFLSVPIGPFIAYNAFPVSNSDAKVKRLNACFVKFNTCCENKNFAWLLLCTYFVACNRSIHFVFISPPTSQSHACFT